MNSDATLQAAPNRLQVRLFAEGSPALVTDGSLRAYLSDAGFQDILIERYNLTQPIAVERAHRAFAAVGAELIVSNTEHANPLSLERWNLRSKTYEINRKGVWLARTAASERGLFVAAAVGPIGKFLSPVGPLQLSAAREAYREQILALVDGGPDVLLLRSFIELAELEVAIEEAQAIAPGLPIIAQKTFPEDGALLATGFAQRVAERLKSHQVMAIGSNGTVGPNRMHTIMQSFAVEGAILSAQPDIGIPTLVDGHATYHATPEYVAECSARLVQDGVRIIGAYGGAMPAHIRAIRENVLDVPVGTVVQKQLRVSEHVGRTQPAATSYSKFKQSIGKKFLATVELDVPRGLDMTEVVEGARFLSGHGIDAVNISDGARARLRIDSITLSHLVQSETGMEAMTHLACRDRNMVGLQSELLGAESLGVKNILAVTGDPAQIGDFPYATSVYDIDSIGLIRALRSMNEGRDLLGNPIAGGAASSTHFLIACGCNPVAEDMEREIARLQRKVEEGCEVVFTQPLFDLDALDSFLGQISSLRKRITLMLGLIPLRSVRHAEFLHFEVPGMTIPQRVHDRIRCGATVDAQSAIGVEVCVELLKSARSLVDGVYLMPPFKKYSMAVEILEQSS